MSQSKKTKIEFGPMLEGDMSFEMSYDPEGIEEFQEKINEALGGDQEIRISSDFHSIIGRGYFYPSSSGPKSNYDDEWEVEYTVAWTEGPFWEWWILGDLFNPDIYLLEDVSIQQSHSPLGSCVLKYETGWWNKDAFNYLMWVTEIFPSSLDIQNEVILYRFSEERVSGYIVLPPEGSRREGNFTTLPKEDWLE